jgi:hypothetical protein
MTLVTRPPGSCVGRIAVAGLALVSIPLGVVACAASPSQDATVYGTVFASTGAIRGSHPGPMRDVTVIATNTQSDKKVQTLTSNAGTFSLTLLPGTYLLTTACGKVPPTVRLRPGAKIRRNLQCPSI